MLHQVIWNLGDAYFFSGKYEEAAAQFQKVIDLFGDQRSSLYIGDAYAAQGKYPQAVEAYLKDYQFANEIRSEEIQSLKQAFESGGWEAFQRKKRDVEVRRLTAKQTIDPNEYVRPYYVAVAHSWAKDKAKTLVYLNKAYEDRSADILRLRIEITFAFLRDDPRFKELAAKIGIPD